MELHFGEWIHKEIMDRLPLVLLTLLIFIITILSYICNNGIQN